MSKKIRAIDEIKNRDIKVPWHVGRFVGFTIWVHGENASLHDNGDSGTVGDIRTALEWYVDQFGGKVEWE